MTPSLINAHGQTVLANDQHPEQASIAEAFVKTMHQLWGNSF